MISDDHRYDNQKIIKSNKIELDHFNEICLKENNRLRQLHNCPKLKLNYRLIKSAQIHSEYLQKLHQLQKIDHLICGQNMALIIGQQNCQIAGLNAIRAWYKQSESYDYNEDYQEHKGYFTQMIWKKTKEVGFGFTKSEIGNIIFVVGHYLPAGNKTTEFQDNVLPRREGAHEMKTDDDCSNDPNENLKQHRHSCSKGRCVII
ncbi:unnamed protein product [Schistosoma intercalatum]|nr:unnamed protein product [Schistosoma intercalatum]CAH8429413.1 unnamed protein product [Schistosoma intercalatum]CAH8430124.1 unnamed protein product [Schistosoma haematobium]